MDSSWNRFWDSKVEVEVEAVVDVAVVVAVAAAAAMSCKFDLKQKVSQLKKDLHIITNDK